MYLKFPFEHKSIQNCSFKNDTADINTNADTTRDCFFGLGIFLSLRNFRVISNENPIQASTGMIAVLPKGPYLTGQRLGYQGAGMSGTSQDSVSCLPTVASPDGHERQSSKTPHLILHPQRENPEIFLHSSGSG